MKPILATLSGQVLPTPPIWLMRQAGRYLPEYRALRADKGGFLDLVYDPVAACEVTLQPIRRFRMDGAILFSDILVVPDVLGRNVRFTEGEGPKLDPIRRPEDIAGMKPVKTDRYDRVAETVSLLAAALPKEGFTHTTLLGFAGAPFTIACYMLEGGGSKDFAAARLFAILYPDAFQALLDTIVETTVDYLDRQIQAGAEVIQLFDSWAGVLHAEGFASWVIAPTQKLVAQLKTRHPHIPVIGFARKAGPHYADYARQSGVDAISIDEQIAPSAMAELQKICPVQGNLDPHFLLAGGEKMLDSAAKIKTACQDKPFIFNLGHGVIKGTDPAHVGQLVDLIRQP